MLKLSLNNLTFDSLGVTKHGLTYTILSIIHSKRTLVFSFCIIKQIQVHSFIEKELFHLKTNAQDKPLIACHTSSY